mmetsp:Transcript_175665/g.557852  ORF Transcript_175665/g.557852 Transcript_175665/m.557852 type:complete len:778 (+) Transcript_175665:104-2437(+)
MAVPQLGSGKFAEAVASLCSAHEAEVEQLRQELRTLAFGSLEVPPRQPQGASTPSMLLHPQLRPVTEQVSPRSLATLTDMGDPSLTSEHSRDVELSVAFADGTHEEISCDPIARWAMLVQQLHRGRRRHIPTYEILPHWIGISRHHRRSDGSVGFATAAEAGGNSVGFAVAAEGSPNDMSNTKSSTKSSFQLGENNDDWGLLRHFMLQPSGSVRMTWASVGMVFLVWDAVTIPLQVFDFGSFDKVASAITTTMLVYWLIDMPMQFFIGFRTSEGLLEMRHAVVRQNYCRSWFWPDLLVLTMDVLIYIIVDSQLFANGEVDDETAASAQAGTLSVRLTRLVRLLRFVRLIRARRLRDLFSTILDRLGSEHILLAAKLAKYIILIVLCNHYVACAWYALAAYSSSEQTWIIYMQVEGASPVYQYAMALHWCLTQCSPSTQNVVPTNLEERFFACVVSLTAMFVFASFISSVTNSVNQIRLVNMEPMLEEAKIREFMLTRGVSTDLFARIQNFFKRSYRKQKKLLREEDIVFFRQLPEILRIQMHLEIYSPKLLLHPVFDVFCETDRDLFKKICHVAMTETCYLAGQDVFIDGTKASGFYFVNSGLLAYDFVVRETPRIQTRRKRVRTDTFMAEMAMYVQWVHAGHLQSVGMTDIVKVGSTAVAMLVGEHDGPLVLGCLRNMAILLVAHVEEKQEAGECVNDLPFDEDSLVQLARRAYKFTNLQQQDFIKGNSKLGPARRSDDAGDGRLSHGDGGVLQIQSETTVVSQGGSAWSRFRGSF